MTTSLNKAEPKSLPTKPDFTMAYVLSLVVALLMTLVSIFGLFFPSTIYPSQVLVQTFVPNDVVNLFIGLPIIVVSMWLTRRDRLIGLLTWPGALLYVIYNYIGYLFGIPLSVIILVYLALVALSAYILIDLVKNIESESVKSKLLGSVPEKFTGWILVVFGVLFIFRAVSIFVQAIIEKTALPMPEISVLIADFVVSILWIIGGALLIRRNSLGYVSGLGLLFAASMLFVGLIVFLVLQPVLTEAPFVLTDVIVVLVMGLVCFIPFALFVRGVLSSEQPTRLSSEDI